MGAVKTLIVAILIILAILFVVFYFFFPNFFSSLYQRAEAGYKIVSIGEESFKLEVADTEEKQVKGLSDRDSIPGDEGMIFLFGKPGNYGIWTKGMRFSIDIIWLRDNKVVDVAENIPPPLDENAGLKTYYPGADADAVIELKAGTIKKVGLSIGDEVNY